VQCCWLLISSVVARMQEASPECSLLFGLFEREVSSEDGEDEAKKHGVMFIETSAKAGFNVKALFHTIALKLATKEKEEETSSTAAEEEVNIKLESASETRGEDDEKMSCCSY